MTDPARAGAKRPAPADAPTNDRARRALAPAAMSSSSDGRAPRAERAHDVGESVRSSSSGGPTAAGAAAALVEMARPRAPMVQQRLDDRLERADVRTVAGSVLEADTTYIVHQCNCRTRSSRGLATAVFARWPAANTYADRFVRVPGSVDIRCGRIVNLYGQDRPGGPSRDETAEQRLTWFRDALAELAQRINGRAASCGFPYGIGCGLAGGDWRAYEQELRAWQCRHPNIAVRIYRYSEAGV